MKIYWSAFLLLTLLLALASCGGEQFGTTPQSSNKSTDAVVAFQQASCSEHTEIKPLVDILYVVDNSASSNSFTDDVRTSIQNTIGSISAQFDYRVIATPLLETAESYNDYQVLSKSSASLPESIPSTKIITAPSQFTLFSTPVKGKPEAGLGQVQKFIANHQSDLFRQKAYLFIVLVSNGRDTEVEQLTNGDSEPHQVTATFNERKQALLTIKSYLQSQQMRLFSVTANTACVDGYVSSKFSYAAMSQALYNDHAGFAAKASADHYDLCSKTNISSVFVDVNANIKQIIIPHKYKYWPITFSETATGLNIGDIKVYKSSPTQSPSLLPTAAWTYVDNQNRESFNTRVEPTAGEPSNARHMIQFTSGNEITYPDCVQITSTSNLEYFGYVVLPKTPKPDSIVLKINGKVIAASSSNGYSLLGQATKNIKVQYNGFADTPTVIRTGYMLQLNGGNNYYKSGDNVEIYYVPQSN